MARGEADFGPDGVRAALVRLGLLGIDEPACFTALAGGVASDIYRVDTARGSFAVKRALAKLRVAADWFAPVERNASEVAWLEEMRAVSPDAVPDVLGHDSAAGLFAMAYLPPERYPVWKSELRDGHIDIDFASEVGRRIAALHAATAGSERVAASFETGATFHSIRLEPYLEATARAHPALSLPLMALSRATLANRTALVHGDVSPKNILSGPRGPLFLDAECAWYGDPAFDLAFCLNHLLLKCAWRPAHATRYLGAFDALAMTYLSGVTWEAPADLEARAAALLPGLFLARVDGKSPVEYIAEGADRARVRRVACPLVAIPPKRLSTVRDRWARELGAG